MKKALLLLCLLAVCHFSFAQNWMPFRVGETYNYLSSDTSFVYPSADNCGLLLTPSNELQIWIDAVIVANNDSIFCFNKRVLPCDTCFGPAILVNQPLDFAILHDTFVKNGNGQYVFHYNNDSLIINPFWALNDSIISDSSTMLFAKMAEISFDTLSNYALFDSIKTVHYYDINNILKYQIVLTKNHGINSFQDFTTTTQNIQQVGIESKDLGKVQLNWKRIYDFNVGDIFYRHFYLDYAMGEAEFGDIKEEVTNRQDIAPDTILYTITTLETTTSIIISPGPTTYSQNTYNIIVTKENIHGYPWWWHKTYNFNTNSNSNKIENLRDNELFSDDLIIYGGGDFVLLAKNFLSHNGMEYKHVAYSLDTNYSVPPFANYGGFFYVEDSMSNLYPLANTNVYWHGELHQTYGKGLGTVCVYEPYFEGFTAISLQGYIKNNDTTGTIIPDHVLLGTENLLTTTTQGFNITLYPNPAQENFTLELDKLPLTDFLKIEIIDLHGRVLLSQQKTPQNSYTISVEDFSNGLYLLQLKDERGEILGLKKFVVKK